MMNLEVKTVGPRGPEDSPFVIVGEAPGSQEIKHMLPFVGPSGQVLQYALDQLPKDYYPEPYITNTYKSLITKTKDPAYLTELAMNCRPALLEEIGKHKRRIIIACGSVALQALTGNASLKITQVRGKIFPSELADVGVIASVHPAFLLRGNGSLRQFKSDILHAMHIAMGGEPRPWKAPSWSIVQSREELEEHISFLQGREPGEDIYGDCETTGFSPITKKILSQGHTWDGNHVHIVNGHKTDALAAGIPNLLPHYRGMYQNQARWGWHNGKFDCKFMHAADMPEARVDEDSMLQSYALDEQRGMHDLETVSGDWLNSPNWKKALDEYLPKRNSSYDLVPYMKLFEYQAYDIGNGFRLVKMLRELIHADPVSKKQYYRSLLPASPYLMSIEKRGIYVDQERVASNLGYMAQQDAPFVAQIHEIAEAVVPGGHAASIWTDKLHNSPKQLAELMFDRMQLKAANPRVRIVRSTDDDTLEKLQQVPIVVALRNHRKIAKALGTYVKPFTQDPEDGCIEPDGRVHTTYLIHGTATGRLSSRGPNLQNIPRDPIIRGQLIAPPGRMFIEPDLNQAELRSLAILSGDPALCKIYIDGTESLHEKVRREMYGNASDWSDSELQKYMTRWYLTPETRYDPETKEDRILAEQKMRAKNVNFGIVYGITAQGLAEQTGDSVREAQIMLDTWAKTFPVAWEFIKTCRRAPLYGKNLVTVFGYRKRFQIVTPETLAAIQNESANMPHQSTANSITMHAGMRTYEKLEEYDAFYCNTVHDSLLIEAPLDYTIATTISDLVCNEMQQVPKDWGLTEIPFVSDAKWGLRWGSQTSPKKFAMAQGWLEAA